MERVKHIATTALALAQQGLPRRGRKGASLSKKVRDTLRSSYSIPKDDAVLTMVARERLGELLIQAAGLIRERFSDCGLGLEMFDDRLSVIITTDLEVDDANARLHRLERDWWVDARGDKLCVFLALEFN